MYIHTADDQPLQSQESIRNQTLSIGSHFDQTLPEGGAGSISRLSVSATSADHIRADGREVDHLRPVRRDSTRSDGGRSSKPLRPLQTTSIPTTNAVSHQKSGIQGKLQGMQRGFIEHTANNKHEDEKKVKASRWRKAIQSLRREWKVIRKR